MSSTKLYVVRHFIEAKSIKEAVNLTINRPPDEVFVADEWVNKVGFLDQGEKLSPAPIGYATKKSR